MISKNTNYRSIDRNIFSFEGCINELNLKSEVANLYHDELMSLSEAFQMVLTFWNKGKSDNRILYLISHDFEGQIINLPAIDNEEFAIGINYLLCKKLSYFNQIKQKKYEIIKLYQ